MAITETELRQARERAKALEGRMPKARAACIDVNRGTLVVEFENGVLLSTPVSLLQGLSGARAADIVEVRLSPSGMGLHFPNVDADVYLPALLDGVLGTKSWMRQVGN